MAKAAFKMPDDFLMRISKLGENTDRICEKVLEAGAEVVEDKVRANLRSSIGKGTKQKSRSTGELLKALGTSSVKQDRNGSLNIKVGFSEPRSDGNSNAKIAAVLEYGKSGQPPRPFMKPAKTASKESALNAMTKKFESEIKKL